MASNSVFTADKTEISEVDSFSVRRTGWETWDASLPWESLADFIQVVTQAYAMPPGSIARGTVYQAQNIPDNYRPQSIIQWLDTQNLTYVLSIYYDELPSLASVLSDLADFEGESLDLDMSEMEWRNFTKNVLKVVDGPSGLGPRVTDLEAEVDALQIVDEGLQDQITDLDGRADALEPRVTDLETDLPLAVPNYLSVRGISTITELRDAFSSAATFGLKLRATGAVTTAETLDVIASANLEGFTLTHTGNVPAISIATSDISLEGGEIVGPGNTGAVHLSRAIYAKGTVGAYLQNINIRNVKMRGFKMMGVSLEFVNNFIVEGCEVDDVNYAGVHCMSVNNGSVSKNRINDVTGTPLAYGITINKAVASEAVAPRSTDVIVSENLVTNVPNWEGLDTHGGERISFINNIVTGCHRGIAVVYGLAVVNGDPAFGCHDIVVTGNIIDSGRTDGGAGFGISFAGASTAVGTAVDRSTGVIANNVIRDHGDATSSSLGCIYLHSTKGVIVTGNSLINPSAVGINILHTNDDIEVVGNTVTEVWGTTTDRCIAIAYRNQFNNGTVAANRLAVNGEHAGAPFVNHTGFQVTESPNNQVLCYGNDFTRATIPIGATAQAVFRAQFMASAVVGRAAALTPANAATVDDVYGADERDVIINLRSRVNAMATVLQSLGFIA